MNLTWIRALAPNPLCAPPCADTYMVNACAISDNGNRAVGATYYFNYEPHMRPELDGTYGAYCYGTSGSGTELFKDEFVGDQGLYCVAMSGDGKTAAAGGLLTMGTAQPFTPKKGLLRAYEVPSGNKLLDSDEFSGRVTSISLSRTGKVLAAVTDRDLRVFIRSSGPFSNPPPTFLLDGKCHMVAVHPSGDWLAAADTKGCVYVFTITGGTVNAPKKWTALEREEANDPLLPVKLLAVAVAREADTLVVGGKDFVYLLSLASISAPTPSPLARFTTFGGKRHDVRWVAIADDGSFITVVMNDRDQTGRFGRLTKLTRNGGTLTEAWQRKLDHPPNSTSINGAAPSVRAAWRTSRPTGDMRELEVRAMTLISGSCASMLIKPSLSPSPRKASCSFNSPRANGITATDASGGKVERHCHAAPATATIAATAAAQIQGRRFESGRACTSGSARSRTLTSAIERHR
jgi:WD40 repeat protein